MTDGNGDPYHPWLHGYREYLRDYSAGRYDAVGHLWFIRPQGSITIEGELGALVVGDAGCDGITFCLRKGLEGVWAFYPIDSCWERIATNLRELECGWLDGSISV
ncbi:MAG: hypothetical protein JWP35_2084 [Caulobacter sp.]|nr:hypothetical protein [Caulobacter sp.]